MPTWSPPVTVRGAYQFMPARRKRGRNEGATEPVSERLSRLFGGVSVCLAEEAAARIPSNGTLLGSGFGSVEYPKTIPTALATDGRDDSFTLISGGSVG